MSINKKQTRTLQVWLALVVLLALFPPFEISKRTGENFGFQFEKSTRHEFVLNGQETPINMSMNPNFPDSPTDQNRSRPYFLIKAISLHTFLCELLALMALAGFIFVSIRDIA